MSNPKPGVSRRLFLRATLIGGAGLSAAPSFAAEAPRRFRAAVVGHTGGGDYGHGYDQIFNGLDQVEVVAVADPEEAGARKAAARAMQEQDGNLSPKVSPQPHQPTASDCSLNA